VFIGFVEFIELVGLNFTQSASLIAHRKTEKDNPPKRHQPKAISVQAGNSKSQALNLK